MADFIKLFTSFSGRINRAWWWLGSALLVVVNFAENLILALYSVELSFDPVDASALVWAITAWHLVLAIPLTAITVKRFNDRDWPNWLGYAWGLLAVLYTISPFFGFRPGPGMSMSSIIAIAMLALLSLLVFIDNGFLRGTPGPNRYGPDPLQAT